MRVNTIDMTASECELKLPFGSIVLHAIPKTVTRKSIATPDNPEGMQMRVTIAIIYLDTGSDRTRDYTFRTVKNGEHADGEYVASCVLGSELVHVFYK